jgi:hypothetical protein
MWIMHTDYRCREDRKGPGYSNAEIYPGQMQVWEHNAWNYGHEIEYLRKTIADLDDALGRNAQMMLYADMLDSHNGQYAEGRCRWNWYVSNAPDELHQPDSDDPIWVGNVNSHDFQYYKPAMGGMGGWTWDTRTDPDGLTCNTEYGMTASRYITKKDTIICREWGYQAGYFDDRDAEHVILWQEKFKERYDNLMDQGFSSFVGDCAGYALGLEGGEWGGVTLRCEDRYEVPIEQVGNYYTANNPLDGTNLNWALIKGYLKKETQDEIDVNLYLNVCAEDPSYSPDHCMPTAGKGCHIGTVQDGVAYLDDISLKDGIIGKIVLNPSYTMDLSHWEIYPGVSFVSWSWTDKESHQAPGCCHFTIDRGEL